MPPVADDAGEPERVQAQVVADDAAEVERLRAQVAAQERELAALDAHSGEIVARAQRGTRWLDELGIDLNRVVARPGVEQARGAFRGARQVVRIAQARVVRPARGWLRGG
jgi:ABC-type phosphonate transport system ATPase subunit